MKIAIFTDGYWPTVGGVVTSVIHRAILLAQNEHQILIIAPKPPKSVGKVPGFHKNIKVHFSPAINLGFKTGFRLALPSPKLLSIVRDFNPDIVHTTIPFTIGYQGLSIGKKLGKPLITTHYTNYSDAESLKFFGLSKNFITEKLQQKFAKKVIKFVNQHDKVIVLSDDSKRDIRSQGVIKSIAVIPAPIDFVKLQSGKKKGLLFKSNLGLKKTLIYVGRISGEKNIDLLIRSFYVLQLNNDDLKLVLIGDGQHRKKMENLCHELKINDKVIWMGKVPHDQLINDGYFYLGDIFITLSKFETQGISTVEAMACGLPIIAADARASTEIVKNVGILVDPSNQVEIIGKIQKLLDSKETYKKLSLKSINRANDFSPKNVLNNLEELYLSVLGKS